MEFFSQFSGETIALSALLFTVWQFGKQRKHDRLCNLPHLDSWTHTDTNKKKGISKGIIVYQIRNNGLGPARIKSFDVFLDGKEVDVDQGLEVLLKGKDYLRKKVVKLAIESAIPAKERFNLLELEFLFKSEDEFDEWLLLFERVRLRIKYQSIFEEEQTFDTDDK